MKNDVLVDVFHYKNREAKSVYRKLHLLLKVSFHIEDINDIKNSK